MSRDTNSQPSGSSKSPAALAAIIYDNLRYSQADLTFDELRTIVTLYWKYQEVDKDRYTKETLEILRELISK